MKPGRNFVCLACRSSKRPLKTVKLESGELTTTEAQRQQRWQEHFCKVAAGKLHVDPALSHFCFEGV